MHGVLKNPATGIDLESSNTSEQIHTSIQNQCFITTKNKTMDNSPFLKSSIVKPKSYKEHLPKIDLDYIYTYFRYDVVRKSWFNYSATETTKLPIKNSFALNLQSLLVDQ